LASCLIPAKVCVRNGGAPDFFPALRVALPSGSLLQFVFFFLLAPRSQSWRIRQCQGCACAPSVARPALDVVPPGLHCAAFAGGRKTAAGSCLPTGRAASPSCIKNPPLSPAGHRPERGRTPDEPPRPPAHSPPNERPLDLPWERSDARGGWGHVAPRLSTSPRQPCQARVCNTTPSHCSGAYPAPSSANGVSAPPSGLDGRPSSGPPGR